MARNRLHLLIRQHWPVLLYAIVGILLRIWNLRDSLYFIYDQGRDAQVLARMAQGDFVLVGPTSGLQGFFLGPLWYYVGLPGFILSGGNPYGICLWYMLISCLALPGFWWLAHKVFKEKSWAFLLALLLCVLPGPLTASSYVWNPLLMPPLLLAGLYCAWKVQTFKTEQKFSIDVAKWLIGASLAFSLILQSEFAYGVFLFPTFLLLIPWLLGKFRWQAFAIVLAVCGMTFLPQALFELRNHFIMSNSLLQSLGDTSTQTTWQSQFARRPLQLWSATAESILGPQQENSRVWRLSAFFLGIGVVTQLLSYQRKKLASKTEHSFLTLLLILGLAPYLGFLFWRGNQGNFFWYYFTGHFIFLLPFVVLGLREFIQLLSTKAWQRAVCVVIVAIWAILLTQRTVNHWLSTIGAPNNQAGLTKMVQSVKQIYIWEDELPSEKFIVKTFTANIYTNHYDYLFSWYAHSHAKAVPDTVLTPDAKQWYLFIESRPNPPTPLFEKWYIEATTGGQLVKSQKIGVLTLEEWQRP